jgi:hypothetical protein
LRNSEAKIEILLPSFDQINLAWTGAEDMQTYSRNAPVLTPVQIPVEISILPFPFKHIEEKP